VVLVAGSPSCVIDSENPGQAKSLWVKEKNALAPAMITNSAGQSDELWLGPGRVACAQAACEIHELMEVGLGKSFDKEPTVGAPAAGVNDEDEVEKLCQIGKDWYLLVGSSVVLLDNEKAPGSGIIQAMLGGFAFLGHPEAGTHRVGNDQRKFWETSAPFLTPACCESISTFPDAKKRIAWEENIDNLLGLWRLLR
jgi:hypothetical protein